MACNRCGSEYETIKLSNQYQDIELCSSCFKDFHHIVERNRAKNHKKELKKEQKILKKYVNEYNNSGVGFGIVFIVFLAFIIMFYLINK